jgi:nucleoside-diphosphate-sugar epimerase
MSKGLALVTGANGFIAGRTIEAFLQAGFSVRATARSASSTGRLQAALSQYSDRLEIVEVKDITAPNAFTDALKGVTVVAHLASPVSLLFKDPEPVLRTAVEGTTGILKSAAEEPSIKTFVLLSSFVSMNLPPSDGPRVVSEKTWNDWSEALVEKMGKNTPGPVIYSASKAKAEKAFWAFRAEHKPHFSMVSVNPSFVTGPAMARLESPKDINETTEFLWDVFRGGDIATAGLGAAGVKGSSGFVDVRDVARVVVWAVETPEVADGQRYLLSASFASSQAAADILRKAYPDRKRVIQEGKPGSDYLPGYKFDPKGLVQDSSKAIRETGREFIGFEKTVLDTAKTFEHLL